MVNQPEVITWSSQHVLTPAVALSSGASLLRLLGRWIELLARGGHGSGDSGWSWSAVGWEMMKRWLVLIDHCWHILVDSGWRSGSDFIIVHWVGGEPEIGCAPSLQNDIWSFTSCFWPTMVNRESSCCFARHSLVDYKQIRENWLSQSQEFRTSARALNSWQTLRFNGAINWIAGSRCCFSQELGKPPVRYTIPIGYYWWSTPLLLIILNG